MGTSVSLPDLLQGLEPPKLFGFLGSVLYCPDTLYPFDQSRLRFRKINI